MTTFFHHLKNIEKVLAITTTKMLVNLILTICLAVATSSAGPSSGRIVNGTDAAPGEIPYIVSLRSYGSHSCGGSIIDERHVLTAAHCVQYATPMQLTIQYGITEITRGWSAPNIVQVSEVTYNPNYARGHGYYNDVAVLELEEAIVFSDTVKPISLPEADAATPDGCQAVLAGWGLAFTGGRVMEHLQKVTITVYTDEDCEEAHANSGGGPTDRLYNICAGVPEGGKGQCNGDSGGPLVCDGVLVGVVSWSIKPCTVKGYPGVFAKVSTQVPWVLDHL